MARRRKQDWTSREGTDRERALAHWPKLRELARNHDGDSRNQIRDILDKPFKTDHTVRIQLDDVLWLVEGDHGYENLSYQNDPLWREAWAAMQEFPGEA